MKIVDIMDIPFTYTDQVTFISILDKQICSQHKSFIITANLEIVMKANDDPYFLRIMALRRFAIQIITRKVRGLAS